ncbi:DUF1499 domain-containing protein [Vibrio sp. S9_S30]|uniref:DUF1499 domain-containing protein n=1 Tax=Vibrio sp. S9_S30 TaxID=2720226 RepID=UPI00168120F6|nr:DUF1499 domain-containing protein [Vibrio sp. S9_S30]MBD1558922.1 DUF1499 domain-containing protein [Vibrio sp. S9_S30]
MKNLSVVLGSFVFLSACSQEPVSIPDRTSHPCGDSPNCVSTLEHREDFLIQPFTLASGDITIDQIESVALSMPGSLTAVKQGAYIRIEYTSDFFGFVDDLEIKIEGDTLVVRSESRTGHSDFGINRERTDELRQLLLNHKLIKQNE